MKKIIRLFACCIPIKGYRRTCIYDLQRPKSSCFIPNDLYEILTSFPNKNIDELKAYYNHQYDDIIESYFQFLLDNEFAYELQENELDNFPPLENIWESPSEITNCIISISKEKVFSLKSILQQLSDLRCNAIQFFLPDNATTSIIKDLTNLLEGLRIFSVEFLLNYNNSLDISNLTSILDTFPRIRHIGIGNYQDKPFLEDYRISYSTNYINFQHDCGKISSHYFSISIDTFFEAKQYNSCLNRKLFIDSNGNIKNCPSSKQIYGNVQDTTLKSIIENPKFKDIWLINKDKIDVCKDCEFRYMCTDCRCFLKQSNNVYSQPYKCTYNPYIALWESENGYVPVEECGTFDKNFKFIPNHEKILLLNQKIWNND